MKIHWNRYFYQKQLFCNCNYHQLPKNWWNHYKNYVQDQDKTLLMTIYIYHTANVDQSVFPSMEAYEEVCDRRSVNQWGNAKKSWLFKREILIIIKIIGKLFTKRLPRSILPKLFPIIWTSKSFLILVNNPTEPCVWWPLRSWNHVRARIYWSVHTFFTRSNNSYWIFQLPTYISVLFFF